MKAEITNNRIDILDYLRGFALIGILLVNVLFFLKLDPPSPNSIDASYQRFLYLFVEGRFITIFTFLFGIGFYIFITRAKAKNYNAYLLFIRRLLILFAMGLIHIMFIGDGDTLAVYAVFGLILMPFYRVNKHINLILSLLGIMFGCYMNDKVLLIFPVFLLGLTAGQYRIFETISDNKWKFKVFTIIAFVLSVIVLWFQYKHAPSVIPNLETGGAVNAKEFVRLGIKISPIISACYVGILILLLQYSWVQKLLSPLKTYGRMSLTMYLSQTALVLLFNYCFQLSGNITYFQSLFLCIGIYVIQILFSMVWFQFFKMGPVEWLWRLCTYWKVVPNKK
ncbi:hypothetical protein C6353_24880 [Bacillus toyonensis]|uniref:DUF418 domain-containing protein n=1 Tax=Bacillus toyonensis TaxID=155322 RepID=UPI000D0337FE|nr:DUF418 domain-containing protein [Bacillus toyonensis]PRT14445.1 hypothetical protein C6353_24880 [Bacillus toyonensis]